MDDEYYSAEMLTVQLGFMVTPLDLDDPDIPNIEELIQTDHLDQAFNRTKTLEQYNKAAAYLMYLKIIDAAHTSKFYFYLRSSALERARKIRYQLDG